MKTKLIHSNYDKITGISTATIRTKYGEFTGTSKLHDEDIPVESSFAGCRYAEAKAIMKSKRAEIKELSAQIKVLQDLEKELKHMNSYIPDTIECRKLRRKIYELTSKRAQLRESIVAAGELIRNDAGQRTALLNRIASKHSNGQN